MDNDPYEMKDALDECGVKAASLSGHSPLMRPEIRVPYLPKAIRLAAVGANIVTIDEGTRTEWLKDEECFDVMRYTLKEVPQIAERHQVNIAVEPHQSISKKTEGLLRIATPVPRFR